MSIKNILLLDDDRMVHLLVQQLSRKAALPWLIRHVYFLEEALRLINTQSFDLMLSDVHLQHPHKVWHLLNELPNESPLPVVLASSAADHVVRQKATEYPRIKAVIDKPLPITKITQIHQQYLVHPTV